MMTSEGTKTPLFSYMLSFSLLFIMSCESFNETRYLPVFFLLFITAFYYIFFIRKISVSLLYSFGLVLSLVIILGALSSLPVLSYKQNLVNYGLSDFYISIVFKLLVAFFILALCPNNLTLINIIKGVLIVHLSVFYVQAAIVYLTGYYIDLLYPVTGELQRFESLFFLPWIGAVYRPTGLYVEPSTFSSFILWLLSIKILCQKNFCRFDIFVIVSSMLSLSLAAIVYGAMFLLLALLCSGSIKLIKKIQFVLLLLPAPFVFYEIFKARLEALGGSGESLRENLNKLVFSQDPLTLLFGNGLLGLPAEVSDLNSGAELWRLGIAALNDNGLWLFFIIKVGLVGLFILIIIMLLITRKKIDFIVFGILLLTKVTFFSFIFVFYFLTMVYLLLKRGSNYEKNTIY